MTTHGEEFTISARPANPATGGCADAATRRPGRALPARGGSLRTALVRISEDPQIRPFAGTVFTTFAVFGIFLVQGILVARILGATGRGEFGTALYFPRDILLWAGLLGAVEIVTACAARNRCDPVLLKYSAARLGLITGSITAVVAAVLALVLLIPTGKFYLLPYCLLCCLFVPWEHMQLTISSVDRGTGSFVRYNVNRLIFAAAFPLLLGLAWLVRLDTATGIAWLPLSCGLFVISKCFGLLPTLRGMHLFSGQKRRELLRRIRTSEQENVPNAGLLLREGRPYALSLLVSELFERLDVFLILVLAPVIDSGYYFVAVPAAAMLTVTPNALGIFTFNAGARKDVRVTRSMAIRMMAATALFQVLATIVFALVVGELIVFFYSSEFAAAIPFAMWLLPASAIKGFLQAADGYLKGCGQPMIGVYARALSILVMLGVVAVAFNRFGLLSVPMAACAGQAVSMVIIVAGVLAHVDLDERESGQGGDR